MDAKFAKFAPKPGSFLPGKAAGRALAAAAVLLFAAGCTDVDYQIYRTDLKTGDVVPLYEWPDSAYVAGIEAMLAAEVLTDEARKADVAITIDPRKPAAPPKGMGHAGIRGATADEIAEAGLRRAAERAAAAPRAEAAAPRAAKPDRARFADDFLAALDRLSSDPRKGISAEVRNGEDLSALLVRQYGNGAKTLPLGVVEYQLKLMNPGVDLRNLVPGETVLLPRL